MCQGETSQSSACSTTDLATASSNPDCVVWGGWSSWGPGSVCSASCSSTQTRTCSNPTPYNYKTCEGDTTLSKSCSGGQCNPGSGSTSGEIKSPNFPQNYPSITTY